MKIEADTMGPAIFPPPKSDNTVFTFGHSVCKKTMSIMQFCQLGVEFIKMYIMAENGRLYGGFWNEKFRF